MKIVMPAWILNDSLLNLTEASVRSIRESGDHHITIIDNGSVLGGAVLRDLADTYVKNKVNRGYSGAVNQGLKLCDPEELVCVSNNDIRVPQQWASVAEDILKDRSVCSVHYRMIPYDQPFNPGNETWITGKERWCTSSFFVVRNLQLYDENYRSGIEDWDFWKRMRDRGLTTAYTNKAEYQHLDSSTLKVSPSNDANQEHNIKYYISKWGRKPEEDFEERFPGQLSLPWKPQP
jgi:GT2 family glycosyltransferase